MPESVEDLATIHDLDLPVGGKAWGLARLPAAGFPVPPGWVILPEGFAEDCLTADASAAIIAAIDARQAQQPGTKFAIRSSGQGEDSITAAFTGVFQTVLNGAGPESVLEAAATVYTSRHQADAYRRARGLDREQLMAFIVQELVPADCAGVAGPLWTPFFHLLGGLILEKGLLGQHAAATAREYGIPAVIGVTQATHRLIDGQQVTVDGTAGTVDT